MLKVQGTAVVSIYAFLNKIFAISKEYLMEPENGVISKLAVGNKTR